MDDWEKLNGTTSPKKEEFYSNLSMEDITDADYMHVKRVCKDFKIKSSGKYHDLYIKIDKKLCLKIYRLDLVKLLLAAE